MQPQYERLNTISAARAGEAFRARSEAFDGLLAEVLPLAVTGDDSGRMLHTASVYTISVAARLVQMHPQTLRKYDREELVSPSRTGGMQRLYSDEDLGQLRMIGRLVDDLGLNHDGVTLVREMARLMQDVIKVLESSGEVAHTRAARLVAQELRAVINYLNSTE